PYVKRVRGVVDGSATRMKFTESDDPQDHWADLWIYDDMRWPLTIGYARVGLTNVIDYVSHTVLTYDEILPGCFDQAARLVDMDTNHTEASLCFPTVPRFCGQMFLDRADKEFAYVCL